MIPYGRQFIDEDDVNAVVAALHSDYLTTGPKVAAFERCLADYVGVKYGVAVNSGTAALHAAMFALDLGPDDEVIVPPMTFAASANCVLYVSATPVFVDVNPDTLLVDTDAVESRITDRTRAIMGVDYAGHPCDWDKLRQIADTNNLALVADSCHALGAQYNGRKVGSLADMTVFSFHPVKHITTGEGGMIVTDDPALAARCRLFRNHGITSDYRQRESEATWFYEMVDLGFNYRITDIQCALGISQLKKLDRFLARRRTIAGSYHKAFMGFEGIRPLAVDSRVAHGYHLYVVRVDAKRRGDIFKGLRERGVGVNVHYIPVHLHPYYRKTLGTGPGQCPVAESAYEEIISLPIHPGMSDVDVTRVIEAVTLEITPQKG